MIKKYSTNRMTFRRRFAAFDVDGCTMYTHMHTHSDHSHHALKRYAHTYAFIYTFFLSFLPTHSLSLNDTTAGLSQSACTQPLSSSDIFLEKPSHAETHRQREKEKEREREREKEQTSKLFLSRLWNAG